MPANIVFSIVRFENNFMNIEVKSIISADAALMLKQENCLLIDVRTPQEWRVITAPSLNSRDVVFLSLMISQGMSVNPDFVDDFIKLGLTTDLKLLFVCRSGARSGYAAEICAGLGYECYNITDGIEALTSAIDLA